MYGNDSRLLYFRSMVLETVVDSVNVRFSKESAMLILDTTHVDLFIICQTVSREECDDLIAKGKIKWPWTKMLVLQGTNRACPQSLEITWMNPLDGPAKLLERVDHLLRVH